MTAEILSLWLLLESSSRQAWETDQTKNKEPMIARYVVIGLLACTIPFAARAQRSLESLVSEAKAGWMFGQWQGTGEKGEVTTLSISWDLEKHVVLLHLKMPGIETKGYTVIEPKSEMPRFYSFDKEGTVSKGAWAVEGSDLVLRVEAESATLGSWKQGFVFTGNAREGLQVRLHGIDSSGNLTTAKEILKFKKDK